MGKYIIIEGDEGSGKTTQVELLAKRLRRLGRQVETVREPGGDPVGELLRLVLKGDPADERYCQLREQYFDGRNPRISPYVDALGFLTARMSMRVNVVYPLLVQGKDVVSDRGEVSTLVYQGIAGGVDIDFLRSVSMYVATVAPPTTMIVLDVPLEVSQQRQADRGLSQDRFESRGEVYRQGINNGYRQIADSDKYPLVNANQPIKSVHEEIWQIVKEYL